MSITTNNFNFLKKIPYLRRFLFKYLKNLAGQNPEITAYVKNGIRMKLSVKDWVQYHLFIYSFYEKNETDYWLKKIKKSKIVIDIGSNVGYYSLIAFKTMERNNGKIYAFEPAQRAFSRFEENILLNKINCIKLYKKAICDKNATLKLNIGNDKNWGMSSVNWNDQLSGEVETVECITLDSFCDSEKISGVDIIKIDVEGLEFSVLKGMARTIETYKPELLIEVLDEHLHKQNVQANDIYNFLWEKGYKSFKIIKNGKLEPIKKAISYEGLILFKC